MEIMTEPAGIVLKNAWLIPAIPLASFALVGLVVRPLSRRLAGVVATTAIFASAILAWILAWEYFSANPHGEPKAVIPWAFEWLRYQAGLTAKLGVLVDPLSVLLMVVVTTV